MILRVFHDFRQNPGSITIFLDLSKLTMLEFRWTGTSSKREQCRVSNDRRPGRLVDHESVVDFEILVGRLLNDGQQGGPAGFGTGNGTLTEKIMIC